MAGDQVVYTPNGPIEVSELRSGRPAVVFEAGLGSYKEVWNKVFPVVAKTHTVFAYDRPGTGRSAATEQARDGMSIADDLRALLKGRGLQPPFVLVGHSAGGLYMQLYARRYPGEVAGLVLVDSTHPTQFEGPGAMRNRSVLANMAVPALTGSANAEFDALPETGRQVLASPPAPADLPIEILTAPDASDGAIAASDNAKRADFARLYPGATIHAVDGGHSIPQERPQAVIDAVQDILAASCRRPAAKC